MKTDDIIDKIIKFMRHAGELAVTNQNKINFFSSNLKNEGVTSVVTQVDFAISNLFKNFINNEFSELNPLIIDEETVMELGKNPLNKVKNSKYTFIIDPIDGTLPYSAKLPLYGISVGVLKSGIPLCGVIYAPALRELVYSDDKKVYSVSKIFTADETTEELTKLPDNIENVPLLLISPTKAKPNNRWNKENIAPIDLYSAVLNCLSMAKGQAQGYYFRAYLWDIAGSMAIFEKLGIKILNTKTGKEFDMFEENTINDKLKIKDLYIVCRPKYFEYLRSIVDTEVLL